VALSITTLLRQIDDLSPLLARNGGSSH